MKYIYIFLSSLVLLSCQENAIKIANNSNTEIGDLASKELSSFFTKMYSDVAFETSENESDADILLLLTSQAKDLGFEELPSEKESYLISNKNNKLYIISPDERGLLNAVYGLLEEQGCGFYISNDVIPEKDKWNGFEGWEIKDNPLTGDRFLFNWHNFLSGCTAWNLEDWHKWIDQANKMRYNGIMVHAYGNNPMFSFEYKGVTKQTGYLNNTASGRDWGNQHVNDVRRFTGGEIFEKAIFGAKASLAGEATKSQVATDLMQQVFKYAEDCGTKVIFALDFDTWMANPENIIEQLPKEAVFEIDGHLMPNPDHPESYQYYKHLLKSFVEMYPEVDQLSVWHRAPRKRVFHGSILLNIKFDQFPDDWKKEYTQKMLENPQFEKDQISLGMFAHSKLLKVILKARDEIKPDLEISSGSWRFKFVSYADAFYPKNIALLPLDWEIVFNTPTAIKILSDAGKNRDVYPIVWAHHDDHRYLGRPYTPWDNLSDRLDEINAKGFGIIHWTTNPLDLYFTSSAKQVWQRSKNEPLEETVQNYVQKYIANDSNTLSNYFYKWITEGPMFGRETSNHFIDLGEQRLGDKMESWAEMDKKVQERMAILNSSPEVEQNKYLRYQKKMEEFYSSFFTNQQLFYKTFKLINENKLEKAAEILQKTDPDKTIQNYVDACKEIGFTSGEKAIVHSMNTRWKIDYINLSQRLGLEPIRFKFSPTQHDPLAQSAGKYTYYIDEDKNWYRCLWENELKKEVFKESNGSTYLQVSDKFEFDVRTIHSQNIPFDNKVQLKYQYQGQDNAIEIKEESEAYIGNQKEIKLEYKEDKLIITTNGNSVNIYEIAITF